PLCCRTSHAHPRATLFPYTTLFRSFLGFIPDETLPSYYHAADVFVLPTRELEGFGLVTVEALACGTPVLGTPVGATPEVLSGLEDRKSTRLNSSHVSSSYAVFCLKK